MRLCKDCDKLQVVCDTYVCTYFNIIIPSPFDGAKCAEGKGPGGK